METDGHHDLSATLAGRMQRQWRWFAAVVPAGLVVGEVVRGTLSSVQGAHWYVFLQVSVLFAVAGIVILRTLARMWLRPRFGPRPAALQRQQMLGHAKQFLYLAWAYAAIIALFAWLMFMLAAPRMYPYILELIAVVYFARYYPRQRFFDNLM